MMQVTNFGIHLFLISSWIYGVFWLLIPPKDIQKNIFATQLLIFFQSMMILYFGIDYVFRPNFY